MTPQTDPLRLADFVWTTLDSRSVPWVRSPAHRRISARCRPQECNEIGLLCGSEIKPLEHLLLVVIEALRALERRVEAHHLLERLELALMEVRSASRGMPQAWRAHGTELVRGSKQRLHELRLRAAGIVRMGPRSRER